MEDAAAAPAVAAPKARRPWLRWLGRGLARGVLVVALLLGAWLSLTPWGRGETRAGLLLPSIIGADAFPLLRATGSAVQHTAQQFSFSNGTAYIDVYAPAGAPPPIPGDRMGLVIISGVGDNRQDAQLVNLADGFAASGIVVMTLTTDALIAYTLAPQDEDAVVLAFQRLQHWPGVGAGRVGMVGFSAGGGLICLAAADPRIRDQVAAVTLFGSYNDTTNLLRDVGRRALIVNGQSQPWQPFPLVSSQTPLQAVTLQVLADTVAPLLPSAEGDLIDTAVNTGVPLDAATVADFSPAGQAVWHLLAGDEPGQVDANIAALTPQIRALLDALSPSGVATQIRAPVYLLHDRNDAYVPYTESRDLNAELTAPHEFVTFSIFQHVEVRSGLGFGSEVGDGARLFNILAQFLGTAG